ncbi:MAG: ferrous iron transport protein A [Bacteroidetes bacterium]|nr:ferrous iron transport protein A [Bacteroidota bacterium]
MKLSEAKKGESVIIESFTDDFMKLKLLEMGCLPGELVKVDRFAPFGDPMAIVVADSIISIRLDEAANVLVKVDRSNTNHS